MAHVFYSRDGGVSQSAQTAGTVCIYFVQLLRIEELWAAGLTGLPLLRLAFCYRQAVISLTHGVGVRFCQLVSIPNRFSYF